MLWLWLFAGEFPGLLRRHEGGGGGGGSTHSPSSASFRAGQLDILTGNGFWLF